MQFTETYPQVNTEQGKGLVLLEHTINLWVWYIVDRCSMSE